MWLLCNNSQAFDLWQFCFQHINNLLLDLLLNLFSFRADRKFARCLESSNYQIPAPRLLSQRTGTNKCPATIFGRTGRDGGVRPIGPPFEPVAVLPSQIGCTAAWAGRCENDLGLDHHATLLVRRDA